MGWIVGAVVVGFLATIGSVIAMMMLRYWVAPAMADGRARGWLDEVRDEMREREEADQTKEASWTTRS